MPTFHYTAKKGPKEIIKGVFDAENRSGVLAFLAQQGYVPVRIREEGSAEESVAAAKPKRYRIPQRALATFIRQFASLVRSAVPLLRALQILEEQNKNPSLQAILRELAEAVRQGQTLSEAMGRYPTVFPPLTVNLIHSGEISGALDSVLERLAEEAERDAAMRAKVRAALTYPCFVGVVGLGTVIFLMTFVMPRFVKLLGGFGGHLPLPTRLLLQSVEALTSGWFWGGVVVIVFLVAVLWRILGTGAKRTIDHLTLRLPLIGPLIEQLEVARFARSFSLLIDHGVPILKAIDVAVPVVEHRLIREELQQLPEGLSQGRELSACLKDLSIGTPFLVNTIAVGEEGGEVGRALAEVARYYEQDAERLLQTVSVLLEPIFIVAVGLVVGFIVMAVLLPVFEMGSAIR